MRVVSKHMLHLHLPYTYPFLPFTNWSDFNIFRVRFSHFHHPEFFSTDPSFLTPYEYPAPDALIYKLFYMTGSHSTVIFLFVSFTLVMSLAYLLGKAMVARGLSWRNTVLFLASAFCLAYPCWIEFSLGNVEVYIFIFVAIAILTYLNGRLYVAAFFIGIATAMKIYPGVYLALFFARKQYGPFFTGIATAVATNIVALWLLCSPISASYAGVNSGLRTFRTVYMLHFRRETGFDHSIYGFYKWIVHFHTDVMPPYTATLYLAFGAVTGLCLYWFIVRRLPILNQILCLCIISILFTPTSHDYTLLHLFLPWGLMIVYCLQEAQSGTLSKGVLGSFVAIALLMSFESEFIVRGVWIAGQIKCLVLIALLYIGLTRRWPISFDRKPTDSRGLFPVF